MNKQQKQGIQIRYRDAGQIPADSDIEAQIEEIKPWYDKY